MRSIKSRLRELVESTGYQKDFGELKKYLLKAKSEYPFVKTDLQKSIEAGVMCRSHIPLKNIQSLLKTGNINGHFIQIPEAYSDFKNRYNLRFFFDPAQPYPEDGLSPFDDKPVTASLPRGGGTRIPMTIDISYPSRVLEALFKIQIKNFKKMWKLKEERRERYKDSEVYEIKKLIPKVFGDTEIFRRLYPEHKNFRFTTDYVIGGSEVGKKFQRVKRLIKRAKERKL
jgi:hypothetical protein